MHGTTGADPRFRTSRVQYQMLSERSGMFRTATSDTRAPRRSSTNAGRTLPSMTSIGTDAKASEMTRNQPSRRRRAISRHSIHDSGRSSARSRMPEADAAASIQQGPRKEHAGSSRMFELAHLSSKPSRSARVSGCQMSSAEGAVSLEASERPRIGHGGARLATTLASALAAPAILVGLHDLPCVRPGRSARTARRRSGRLAPLTLHREYLSGHAWLAARHQPGGGTDAV